MQDFIGSVRRSLVFRPSPDAAAAAGGRIGEKIGSYLRRSRAGMGGWGSPHKLPPATVEEKEEAPPIRWRKGELIGCGAFGHVYMGMNLDSGELLAVKQVLIGTNNASKARAQAHIRELEEEVELLKNLSHPNIVRYLGTVREEETLNILLEFVPGGSISSLLGKFGSFPEPVIRMYTKQLLYGLEYLHNNGIMHRDIKGANILVDNKGCIKLADFGASKQVAKLATMTAAKSMKGTPYWMAPEVILQTGHSLLKLLLSNFITDEAIYCHANARAKECQHSADIWSVGCTVIEMATGKPPWSQQYQEVAALFHIGTTKSHPPIPEHLSSEAKDFLLQCLQKEPSLRPTASDLLQHPFVCGEVQDQHPLYRSLEPSKSVLPPSKSMKSSHHLTASSTDILKDPKIIGNVRESCSFMSSSNFSTARPIWEMDTSQDMCQLYDKDDFPEVGMSFNPMSEPDWASKFDISSEQEKMNVLDGSGSVNNATTKGHEESQFTFPCETACDDDEEVTESKIRAFLDEKALDLKKLQTPLYEEFFNSLNSDSAPSVAKMCAENGANGSKLPPRSKASPSRVASGIPSPNTDTKHNMSPGNHSGRVSTSNMENERALREIPSPRLNEREGPLQNIQGEASGMNVNDSETLKKWEEELKQELEREREMMRQASGAVSGRASPKDRGLNRKRDRLRFTSPGK